MRIVKLALLSFIFLFLLVTGISLFIPSHIRISKAINLMADKDSVMVELKNAARWKDWYPGMDSAKPFYKDGQVKGAVFNGQSPSHPPYIVITKEEESEITAQFISNKMNPVINGWKMISHPASDSLTVQWYMDFHLRWYPWEKFASLLFEKSHGEKMEQGLSRLKAILEK